MIYHDVIAIGPIVSTSLDYHHYHTPLGVIVMIRRWFPVWSCWLGKGPSARFVNVTQAEVSTNVYACCLRLYTLRGAANECANSGCREQHH
jgi:hypothetical protein